MGHVTKFLALLCLISAVSAQPYYFKTPINPKDKSPLTLYQCMTTAGAKFTGENDGAYFNTCAAVCTVSARCIAGFPPGLKAVLTTGITIPMGAISFEGNGIQFDASTMTGGCISLGSGCYAIAVTAVTGTSGGYHANQYSQAMPIGGFVLQGPASSSSTVDGIGIVGNSSAYLANVSFRDINVEGFRDGCAVGSYAFILSFYNLQCSNNFRAGLSVYGTAVAGENLNFHGGNFSGNKNRQALTFTAGVTGATNGSATLTSAWTLPTGTYFVCFSDGEVLPAVLTNGATTFTWTGVLTATVTASAETVGVGIYMANSQAAAKELVLEGVSIDYNNVQILNMGGNLVGNGHIEDACVSPCTGIAPIIYVIEGSGSLPSCVYWDGDIVLYDTTPRTNIVNIAAGYTKGCFVSRARWSFSNIVTNMINKITGHPMINIQGSMIDYGTTPGPTYPTVGTEVSILSNADFEAGALTGWTSSGTNWTWTADAVVFHGGAYSAKAVSTALNGGSILQSAACRPGQQVISSGWINITALTTGAGGHINYTLDFYDATGTIQVRNAFTQSFSATTSGWTMVTTGGSIYCPAGATLARVGVGGPSGAAGFVGTFYIDDLQLEAN